MKLIWYLLTWGQKSSGKELQPILFGKFDLGHPVAYYFLFANCLNCSIV